MSESCYSKDSNSLSEQRSPRSVRFSLRHPQQSFAMPEKVALVGSGNWGSAIATKIGVNVLANDMFDKGARRPY